MATATVRTGSDTWVNSALPKRTYAADSRIRLADGARRGLIYLPSPVPRRAVVVSATLTFTLINGAPAGTTFRLRRVLDKFFMNGVRWANQPGADSVALDVVSQVSWQAGDKVSFDVSAAVQNVANGGTNYGFRVETDADFTAFYSFNARSNRPSLTVEWSEAPHPPSGLSPAGTISVAAPIVSFQHRDYVGNVDIAAIQVQADPGADALTPAFDTGAVLTSSPQLNLANYGFNLALGDATQWRARVRDGLGIWSGWSEWASITRRAKVSVELVSPAPGDPAFVEETSPPIVWLVTGGTQSAYRVRIIRASTGRQIYDSGRVTSAANQHELPDGLLRSVSDTYRVELYVWDTVAGRAASASDPAYVLVVRSFIVEQNATVDVPTNLRLAVRQLPPAVDLTWATGSAPDGFSIRRNGDEIATVEPGDVTTGVNDATGDIEYHWTDVTVTPQRSHLYSVHAITNRRTGNGVVALLDRPLSVSGIVLTENGNEFVSLAGDDAGSWVQPEDAETFTPLGASYVTRIVSGQRAMEGQLSGFLVDGFGGLSIFDQEELLLSFRNRPGAVLRLITADVNLPVILGEITVSPLPQTRRGDVTKAVALSFWQVA